MADAYNFYSLIPYYDKFMHLLVSFIVGIVGMMIIYTFYALGKLQASTGVMFSLIVLITMGLGAGLEMAEYFYDQILYPLIGPYLPTGLTQVHDCFTAGRYHGRLVRRHPGRYTGGGNGNYPDKKRRNERQRIGSYR
nr:hypothetical protein [Methanobacterium formicicum]